MKKDRLITLRNPSGKVRLGILGLALSASPLFTEAALAKKERASQSVPVKTASTTASETAPDFLGYPLDKAAAARRPEGKATVNSLEAALEAAYRNNTEVKELQAFVRSKDEGVPQALAGWRPTVYMNASLAGQKKIFSGTNKEQSENGATPQTGSNASIVQADVTLTQNLFRGGQDVAKTCKAESLVQASRAQLADKEREVLFAAVKAYFEVIAKTSEVEFRKSNELALRKTLEATEAKFKVGEETRTSIAQNQANLAQGIAERERAEAELLAAEATFEQVTGARPGNLKKPEKLFNLPNNLKEAIEIAKKNHPAILKAIHQERANRSAIKESDADLLPKLDLEGQVSRTGQNANYKYPGANPNKTYNDFTTAQQVSLKLKVPLYEGGLYRGRSRGLREEAEQSRLAIETARRKVIQELVEAWETYISAKGNVLNYREQVKANGVSLEGTRQEMLVGSKILLDVLNAQRDLVNSQLNLVRAEKSYYQSAFNIMALMGRLNTLDLKLNVKRYDPTVHYHDVRNSW